MYLWKGLGAVDLVLGQEYSLDDLRESLVSSAFVVHLGLDPAPFDSSAWRRGKEKE